MLPRRLSLMLLALALLPAPLFAQSAPPGAVTLEDLARAVVGLSIEVPPEARTAGTLGTHREGNGVVIDRAGHVLTIGYLILEATEVRVIRHDGREFEARVLGYDAESGLGLLRVAGGLDLEPLPLGTAHKLSVQDPVLVLTRTGTEGAHTATVVSRRTFAGYWEYLLEQAIYTAPARNDYAGAALVDQELRLVGIGSLYLQNAAAEDFEMPGNMFVPIDKLQPILRDLIEVGRPRGKPRPWLGVNVAEQFGRVIVTRVQPQSPARDAGLRPGDIILEVGGRKAEGIEAFYRLLWNLGEAGVVAKLKVLQRADVVALDVTTRDRYRHYRLPGGAQQ